MKYLLPTNVIANYSKLGTALNCVIHSIKRRQWFGTDEDVEKVKKKFVMTGIDYDDSDVETTLIVIPQSICKTMNTMKECEIEQGENVESESRKLCMYFIKGWW